jgi:hypothetical protein
VVQACGASDQVPELIAMARTVESMYREWRRQTRAGMRQLQESSAPLYERTRLFRIYEHTALPGLFHTAEYSMEIMSYWVRFLGLPDDAPAATAARLARQKVLRSGRHRFIVVLAEQALRTRLGTPQVMTAQLEHLLEVMRLPNVSVGINPAMAERYTVAQVPFWIWDDVRVTVETVSARLEITRPDEIALYATRPGTRERDPDVPGLRDGGPAAVHDLHPGTGPPGGHRIRVTAARAARPCSAARAGRAWEGTP